MEPTLDLAALKAHSAKCPKHPLAAERDAALKHASLLKCFSCGKAWSVEADAENCDQAHRETWGHEWVSPRVNDLTARLAKVNEELDAALSLARRLAQALEYEGDSSPALDDARRAGLLKGEGNG
jgi:hypothetical protein